MVIVLLFTHCFCSYFLFKKINKVEFSKLLKLFDNIWENPKNGEILYQNLLEIDFERPLYSSGSDLRQYKFFTEMIKDLLVCSVKHGTDVKTYIPEVKRGLIKNIQYDKRINSIFLGGVYQILLVLLMGVIFLLIFEKEIHIKLGLTDLIIPLFLQVLGLVVFSSGFYFLKLKKFKAIFKCLSCFYKIRSIVSTNFSLAEVIQFIEDAKLPQTSDVKYFISRLEIILQQIKYKGCMDLAELDIYINEMWHEIDFKFEQFNRELIILKLLVLCFFSLTGYLGFMYQLFSVISL